jgi:hypothetical protein
MTDAEIIKALEWWITAVHNIGSVTISKEEMLAVNDLINRQKAEIERLNVELSARMELEKIAKAEFTLLSAYFQVKSVRAEAIKEFAERLKTQGFDGMNVVIPEDVVFVDDIDNLVKEMVGEG